MIFNVLLQVLSELINPLRQQGDLHISGPCIPFVNAKFFDYFGLNFHNFRKCLP